VGGLSIAVDAQKCIFCKKLLAAGLLREDADFWCWPVLSR